MQLTSASDKPLYVIFLDIDGVLLSYSDKFNSNKNPLKKSIEDAESHDAFLRLKSNSYSNNYWSIVLAHHFSKRALANLDSLIKRVETVAKPQIVISSSWRRERTVEELITIYFKMHSFAKYIIDKTSDKVLSRDRSEEIQDWLNQHPEVQHYVILDDEYEDLLQRFLKRFIHVNDLHLLSENDVERALAANPLTISLCKEQVLS